MSILFKNSAYCKKTFFFCKKANNLYNYVNVYKICLISYLSYTFSYQISIKW